MKTTRKKSSAGDDGFASIVIAVVLVLVLSLMTVGFAELMRKETRSALDKQLSSQASFAAESGINDAAKAINAGFTYAKSICGPLKIGDPGYGTPGSTNLSTNIVSDNTKSSYTCLTVNPTPDTLQYGAIDFSQSKSVTISGVKASDGVTPVPISKLIISWQDVNGNQKGFITSGTHDFETATGWTATGILRIGLTPLGSGGVNRDDLINNTSTLFLYPNSSGAVATNISQYNTASQTSFTGLGNLSGGIVDGNCNVGSRPLFCDVVITDLNQVNYLLDMRSVYNKTAVNIAAYDAIGGRLKIKNAQTLIDSTGKSQDVLKRVQVRLPSHTEYFHSDFSLQTAGDVCKQMKLKPDSGSNTCDP